MTTTTLPPPANRSAPGGRVMRIDASFEAVLAGCATVLAIGRPHGGVWRLPAHVAPAAVAVIAAGLLAVAVFLWRAARRPGRQLLVTVCVANTVTAAAALWLASTVGMGPAVRVLVAGTGIILATLALVQARVARRW